MTDQPVSPAHPWALTLPASTCRSRSGGRKGGAFAKRFLRRLAAAGGVIEAVPGKDGEPQLFRLAGAGSSGTTIDARTIDDWCARAWIVRKGPGLYRLTAAGHAAAAPDASPARGTVSSHRRQHGLVGEEQRDIEGIRRQVTADAAESPLAWLLRRRDRHGRPLIDETEFSAGERLRADFTVAGLSQRVTSSWDSTIASGASGRSGGTFNALDLSTRAMDARERVSRALAAVGPGLAGILLEVCCLTNGLEAAERRLGLPQRAGKVVLQIALARLAEHYGPGRQPLPGSGPVRIRSWGSKDYRPAMFEAESD